MLLSISEIKRMTGIDRRKIRDALGDLEPVPGPKGSHLFESSDALPRLPFSKVGEGVYDLEAERARLTKWQADRAKAEAEKISGDLVSIEEVAAAVGEEFNAVRAKLLAIPSRAAPILHGLEPAQIQAELSNFIYEALEELSADEDYKTD